MTSIGVGGDAARSGLDRRQIAISVILITCSLLIMLLALSYSFFGSMRLGLAYLRGESISVEPGTQSIGVIPVGQSATAEFRLANLTRHQVAVLGAKSDCSCTMPEGLPFSLKPGEARTLAIRINPSKKPRDLHSTVVLYTDDQTSMAPQLVVEGRVE